MADKKTPTTNKSTDKTKATKTSVARKTKANSSTKQAASKPVKASQPARQTVDASTQTPAQAIVQPAPTKSGNGLAILALLLSIGALAASGYLVYSSTVKNAANNTNLAVGLTEIQGNIGRISDVVTNLKGDIKQINEQQSSFVSSDVVSQQLQQQMTPIQDQQEALSQTLNTVRQQVSGDDSEYVLSRIGRLLETANVELNLSKNGESALRALSLAEEQVRASNNRSLDVVRTKLLADIDALKATQKADLTAISAKIMSVSAAVETWPLQNEPNAELIETVAVDSATSEETGFFKELKNVAKQMVKEAVRVQKVDALPKPLLVPEQRYFLNQNLRLQLLTAQNAALQGEQVIYQENLSSATQWVKEYFDLRDQRVQDAIESLEGITGVTLQPELHDISATLKSFNEINANPNKG